jgi:hypothetical protein|tara:strand:- start:6796 stop:7008 length:213 start_codon:yes stop_codon:yes gene_type:complete
MKKKVLDITNYSCPITFIKAREFINNNTQHEKIIIIKGEENLIRLKKTLEKNFKIKTKKLGGDIFELQFA